ncbi:SPOR domain-containing protein [Cereibacter changlensis]|uniref:SPOR domain-containing protein n=1 Tax=Cereibacter changlensis TaxID=402884 RepID=UPI0040339B14
MLRPPPPPPQSSPPPPTLSAPPPPRHARPHRPPELAATSGEGLIQIGIFSVEANARRAAATLGEGGVPASVRPETSQDKQIWSVTAGPASDRDALLARVKGLGFSDAYFLSR